MRRLVFESPSCHQGRTLQGHSLRAQCSSVPVHTRRILLQSSLTVSHSVPMYPCTLAASSSLALQSFPFLLHLSTIVGYFMSGVM
jgi:hypothetical protein